MAGATWLDYLMGETGTGLRTVVQQNLALDRNLALRMEWRSLEGIPEFEMGLHVYF